MAERFASVSEYELCEKCIMKQLLNSVFAWYHELSKPRVCFDNSWYHVQPHPIIVYYLRVRDCCECFVFKYTHLLTVQWTRNFQYCTKRSWVQYWKFRVHCTVSKCVYLKTKHELTVSNPFNIQFEFTAGDRLKACSNALYTHYTTLDFVWSTLYSVVG